MFPGCLRSTAMFNVLLNAPVVSLPASALCAGNPHRPAQRSANVAIPRLAIRRPRKFDADRRRVALSAGSDVSRRASKLERYGDRGPQFGLLWSTQELNSRTMRDMSRTRQSRHASLSAPANL